MEKFSKIKDTIKGAVKEEPTELLKTDNITVINYMDWDIVKGEDFVCVLPYLKDEGYLLMRNEFLPSYKIGLDGGVNRKDSNFLTVCTETLKKDETPINAVRRGLYEEVGLVLNQYYEIDATPSIFISKGSTIRGYFYILELNFNDYQLIQPPTDCTLSEKKSKNLKVSLGDIDDIRINDIFTMYLFTKLKYDYKLI